MPKNAKGGEKLTKNGWVFRVEIISTNVVWTKDMKEELMRLLRSSDKIQIAKIDELFEDITLFKKIPKGKVKEASAT